ncbi:MAG: serine--tRNA ligase [Candidatus Omnitrophica bacterium]|nr:serine--tRNA ligase [Candidatus Omnitrophota bacterium]
MFPIKFVRENIDYLKKTCGLKKISVDWESFEDLEKKRRALIQGIEKDRQEHKEINNEFLEKKKKGINDTSLLARAKEISDKIKKSENTLSDIEKKINNVLETIPNVPHSSVPEGKSIDDNQIVRHHGDIKEKKFNVLPHYEIGRKLGIMELEKGAKITGSFFPVFAGEGARLVRALINFMLDTHSKNGFKELWVPALVNRKSMFGTGQLPILEDDMYKLKDDDYFLIPTAEVPVTNFYRDDVIPENTLPQYFCAYTPCFRREAGAYGKETRGLVRVHQFDKVELVKFVKPENSYDELESLVHEAEKILQLLSIPYRVVLLSTADMSFASSKCYDIEVWAPGIKKWLEVSSCSNFEAFQARRADIRYKMKSGKTDFVHTLNGSGIALPRTLIAIYENHQTEKGTIKVPDVLIPYMQMDEIK